MPDYWKDGQGYYRVSKRTMKVMSSKLTCPPVLGEDVVPHATWSFWIPEDIWEAWKERVQRDLRPQDFMEARSEFDA